MVSLVISWRTHSTALRVYICVCTVIRIGEQSRPSTTNSVPVDNIHRVNDRTMFLSRHFAYHATLYHGKLNVSVDWPSHIKKRWIEPSHAYSNYNRKSNKHTGSKLIEADVSQQTKQAQRRGKWMSKDEEDFKEGSCQGKSGGRLVKEKRVVWLKKKKGEKRTSWLCSATSQTFRQINRGRGKWRTWAVWKPNIYVSVCVNDCVTCSFDGVDASLHACEHLKIHWPHRKSVCVLTQARGWCW